LGQAQQESQKGRTTLPTGTTQITDPGPFHPHVIHAIFDADPALVFILGQIAEDRIEVVEPLAGDAVAKIWRVSKGAFSQLTVTGTHAHDSIGHQP